MKASSMMKMGSQISTLGTHRPFPTWGTDGQSWSRPNAVNSQAAIWIWASEPKCPILPGSWGLCLSWTSLMATCRGSRNPLASNITSLKGALWVLCMNVVVQSAEHGESFTGSQRRPSPLQGGRAEETHFFQALQLRLLSQGSPCFPDSNADVNGS